MIYFQYQQATISQMEGARQKMPTYNNVTLKVPVIYDDVSAYCSPIFPKNNTKGPHPGGLRRHTNLFSTRSEVTDIHSLQPCHQEENMRLRSILLLIPWVFFLPACATPGPQIKSLPALSFNAPVNAGARDYLGLPPGVTTFYLNDVDARVIVVEVFQVQCFHCQEEAHYVNELFEQLNKEGLYSQVKVVAIAYGNTPFEVTMYASKYHVPFAIIADPRQKTIAVDSTPAYFILEPLSGGRARVLYSKYGMLPETDQFIKIIKKRSGLK
jgi:peroxiredoxin